MGYTSKAAGRLASVALKREVAVFTRRFWMVFFGFARRHPALSRAKPVRSVVAKVAAVVVCALMAIVASPASAATEPVLAMGFEEGSGQVARDSSELGNDGEIAGANWNAQGKHGGALSFDDANDDWVTVARGAAANPRDGWVFVVSSGSSATGSAALGLNGRKDSGC